MAFKYSDSEPLTVTFDRNVYEGIINPSKIGMDEIQKNYANSLAGHIRSNTILPFISESAFTIEALTNKNGQRRKTLIEKENLRIVNNESTITIGSNPDIFPGISPLDEYYLNEAIEMGFKLLPIFRFARLINPAIKSDWRYLKQYEEYMGLNNKFGEVVNFIEELGGGFRFVKDLLSIPDDTTEPWTFYAKQYKGPEKKFNKAIAEWSDGDSIASHIASDIAVFCTNDTAQNAGDLSVFGSQIKKALIDKYRIKIVSPKELVDFWNE